MALDPADAPSHARNGAPGREDDDDLHPCAGPAGEGADQPAGPVAGGRSRVARGCSAARRAGEHAAEALKGAEQVVMLKWLNVEVPGGRDVLQPTRDGIQVAINPS